MSIRLGRVDDRLVGEDGRSVVLVGQLTLVLSALATTILDVLEANDGPGGCEVVTLADALVRAHGEPPDGASALALTDELCTELAEAGIVVLSADA